MGGLINKCDMHHNVTCTVPDYYAQDRFEGTIPHNPSFPTGVTMVKNGDMNGSLLLLA